MAPNDDASREGMDASLDQVIVLTCVVNRLLVAALIGSSVGAEDARRPQLDGQGARSAAAGHGERPN